MNEDFFNGFKELKGGCYGGFTHPMLWSYDDVNDSVTVRFNVSVWEPYKVLLVETDIPCNGECNIP